MSIRRRYRGAQEDLTKGSANLEAEELHTEPAPTGKNKLKSGTQVAPAKKAVVVAPKAGPAKPKKKYKERLVRQFTYRGILFFIAPSANGKNSRISTIDPQSGEMTFQAEVPRSEAVRACQHLAKLSLTEKELAQLEEAAAKDAGK